MLGYIREGKAIIKSNAGVVVGSSLFISHSRINALMELDMSDHTAKFIGQFPNVDIYEYLHMDAVENNDKIYFLPNKGKYIHCFDRNNNHISCIEAGNVRIGGVVSCSDSIWLIPFNTSDDLTIIDTKTNKLVVDEKWKKLWDEEEIFDNRGIISKGDSIFLIPYGRNYYYYFNKSNRLLKKRSMEMACSLRTMTIIQDNYVFTFSDNKNLAIFKNGEFSHFIIDDISRNKRRDQYFTYVIPAFSNHFFVMPQEERFIILLNVDNNNFSEGIKIEINNDDWRSPFQRYFEIGSQIIYLPYFAEEMLVLDESPATSEKIEDWTIIAGLGGLIDANAPVICKGLSDLFSSNSVLVEAGDIGIDNYVCFLQRKK